MEKKRLYFLGDIHAEFNWLSAVLQLKIFQDSYVIQVGDFGVGFLKDEDILLTLLNEACNKNNVELLVLRGNHDNPKYFKDPLNSFTNIRFVEDYSVLEINDLAIFFLGGAVSVDRTGRKENVNYWTDEVIQIDKRKLYEIVRRYPRIDVVVTHTAPDIAPPYMHGKIVDLFRQRDRSLLWDIEHERRSLTSLFKKLEPLKVKTWIYGHFHKHDENKVNETHFVALDINEFVLMEKDFTIKRVEGLSNTKEN